MTTNQPQGPTASVLPPGSTELLAMYDIDDWEELLEESIEDDLGANRRALLDELRWMDEHEAQIHASRAHVLHELQQLAEREYDESIEKPPEGVTRSRPESVMSGLVGEIAAFRRLPAGTVRAEMAHAHTLVTAMPLLTDSGSAGTVGPRHVKAVVDEADPVLQARRDAQAEFDAATRRDDTATAELHGLRERVSAAADACAEYEQAGIEFASRFTPPIVRERCRKLAARLAGHDAERRHRAARVKREVRIYDLADGMAELVATIPSVHATAIFDRLTKQATVLARAQDAEKAEAAGDARHTDTGQGDPGHSDTGNSDTGHSDTGHSVESGADNHVGDDWRTFEQLRADVFVDMLLTAEPSEVHGAGRGVDATITIVVPILSLLGHDTEPATLNGVTPIPMDDALHFAALAPGWLRVLTDPITGVARELDSYRPSKALRSLIGARDLACRFPGCRRPARNCDMDHIVAWAEGGATRDTNLEALCPRDHTIKHATAWQVEADPEHPGDLVWTSPAGHQYTTTPAAIGPVFTPTELQRLRAPLDAAPPPPPF